METEVKDTIDAEAQRLFLQVLLDKGYKFKWRFWLFEKPYVWITTPDGKWFAERIPLEDVALDG